jgi:type II secretory pathway pseudopilin PulG
MRNLLKIRERVDPSDRASGFTMVEILIALFMASVVIAAAFELFITQHNQLLVQEDVSEIQGNARVAAELLAEEIRKTGYMLPPIVTSIEASNSDPDTLTVRYATPTLAGVVLDQDLGDEYGILRCTGNSISGLYAGDWIYIYDEDAEVGEAFVATNVDYHNNTISHDLGPLTTTYPAGSQLLAVESYSFFLGGGSTDNSSQDLMISHFGGTPEVFAENIENLDFMYYYEDGTSSNQLTNPGLVRMIGINVTAKSLRPDLNSPNGEYRTRDFSLKVKLRNFGLE